ncbi:hypothetical protein [Chryseobacterium sp. M5A1_1a]
MSRTRIVKGTYTKISQEGHSMYSKENIITSAGESVTETGEANGIKYGGPKSPPKSEKRIIDVVMFVAGTTDPVNTEGLKHQANTNYWRNSQTNFWNKIKDLKLQYLDLHIEGDFLSWSGDNNTQERNVAAARLLDLLLRIYKFWKNQEVHLHLIGHSHGGNVVNQFTELIASDANYPKSWKIKSIAYLSTPFFQKKHQLNHSKLHKECKIINVHNEYDLTQQLIADFSLVNLEGLIKSLQKDKFEIGIKTLKEVNSEAITKYLKGFYSKEKALAAWREMSKAFQGINIITAEFINYINSIQLENASLTNEKNSFVTILKGFLQWSNDVHANYSGSNGRYDKITWAENLNLTQGIRVLNRLFAIRSGVTDSYILTTLAKLFKANAGITDSIEVTSWTPVKQTKSLPILDVPIFDKDPYHSRGKRTACGTFIRETSSAVNKGNLEEVLMRLLSQFIKPAELQRYINYINNAEYILTGNLDAELKILRGNMERYLTLVERFNADLVVPQDETDFSEMFTRPGTIPYLAMSAHSLSHTQFWPKVEEGLKNAFSSGKNPGYIKK